MMSCFQTSSDWTGGCRTVLISFISICLILQTVFTIDVHKVLSAFIVSLLSKLVTTNKLTYKDFNILFTQKCTNMPFIQNTFH